LGAIVDGDAFALGPALGDADGVRLGDGLALGLTLLSPSSPAGCAPAPAPSPRELDRLAARSERSGPGPSNAAPITEVPPFTQWAPSTPAADAASTSATTEPIINRRAA
jgi:hypothetical protein